MPVYDLPGKTILTHSPMGLRIEFNTHQEGLLELWISPRPTTSRHSRDRNFSNRDDHTRLFDRMTFPGLSEKTFKKCDYDPFHVVVYFERQTLHIVPSVSSAAVFIWAEETLKLDLKSDKADSPLRREERLFEIEHPDRGELFRYVAALGQGKGKFSHQVTLDEGRSTYARAIVSPGQVMVIAGGVEGVAVTEAAESYAANDFKTLLQSNEQKIAESLAPGSFELCGRPDWQRLMDSSRRVLLGMEDKQGAVRAALNRIYYLIWVRDGSIIEAFQSYAGSRGPLEKWVEFLLENPTLCPPPYEGKAFLMLANPITKWEEDGIFYAIWAVFTAWTQSGDVKWVKPEIVGLLREVMQWKERYIFNEKEGLFGRYFRCESPLEGCRDFGYDNAVGKITDDTPVMYEGKNIHRSYDLYINRFAHNAYVMLAAMDPVHAPEYEKKASALEEKMRSWQSEPLPAYGILEDSEGGKFLAKPYGLDPTDYIWACSIPPFSTEPWKEAATQTQLLRNMTGKPHGTFLAAYFSLLQSIDPLDIAHDELDSAIDYAAKQCYRPGEFLPMPDTVVEMLDMKDGDPYHDVRPQAFSIGPWLATLIGRGLRRLPFGLSVRGNNLLKKIHRYEYRDSRLDVEFTGEGSFTQLEVNGVKIPATLQIPEACLTSGSVKMKVHSSSVASEAPQLLSSSARLLGVAEADGKTTWQVEGFGLVWLRFLIHKKTNFELSDESGVVIPHQSYIREKFCWINFEKKGRIKVALKPS